MCTANICRSAYAELMARDVLGPGSPVEVGSAGTHGYVDHPVDPPMAEQLRARGVDPDGFRSRRLTARLVAEADLVLTAEVVHRARVLEDQPEAFRRVFTLGQLARALDVTGVGVGSAGGGGPDRVRELAGSVRAPVTADDVTDPYRRGEQAAARAAEHLDVLVRRIVPVLG